MFKTLLIDDDPRDREVMEQLLTRYCKDDILIEGQASTVEDAWELIQQKKPQIIFLDVELGNQTGFDLLTRFDKFPFKVVFVTAYERYAIQAIKFNALDYLLKPLEIAELVKTVQKIKLSIGTSLESELKNLIDTLKHPHLKSNRIAVPVLQGYKMVSVTEILYCEAKKEYTNIYCINQPPLCSSINLGEYEDLLTGYSFCRVHHSFLVNKDHVLQYIKGEGGEIVLFTDIRIPVSRRKRDGVVEWLKTK